MARKAKSADDNDLVDEPVEETAAAGVGHNTAEISQDLKHILSHLEGLMEEKSGISEAIKDAMTVAKSKGYDARTIREMLKLRALDSETRREREELRDLYMVAIGLAE